jgi:hypothetical protein
LQVYPNSNSYQDRRSAPFIHPAACCSRVLLAFGAMLRTRCNAASSPGPSRQCRVPPSLDVPSGIPRQHYPPQSQVPYGMQPPRQHDPRLVITRILRPLPRPTARRAAVPAPPVPLRSTAARLAVHPPPQRCSAPRPAASCSCLTSCLRPPRLPSRCARDCASGASNVSSGRCGSRGHLRALRRQVLSSSFPALPRSFLTCAAWSFLRERLTPRPAMAKSTYRFCVRKIRCSPALQNIGNHGAGERQQRQSSGAGRSRLGKHRSSRHLLAAFNGVQYLSKNTTATTR